MISVVLGLVVLLSIAFYRYKFSSSRNVSICDSNSCVRCGRRPTVFEIRFWLLVYHQFSIKRSISSRLWHSNSSYLVTQLGQSPTVLSIHNLPTEELPTSNSLPYLPPLPKWCFQVDSLLNEMSWKENETCPIGTWKIAHLVNQGAPTSNYQLLSEATQQILNQMVPRNKLFGASISWLDINQIGGSPSRVRNVPDKILIAPHHGLTNAKWRVHVPLFVSPQIAQNLEINVNGKTKKWIETFAIDDSFNHFVKYSGNESFSGSRIVLIFDIWNPNLNENEKNEIEFISKWAI